MDRAKDYYGALEVSYTESLEGIHKAYRRLAKQYHPDRAGAQGAGRFRAIQEAYQVLSDPLQRQRYDKSLYGRHTNPSIAAEPLVRPQPQRSRGRPEPFTMSPSDFYGRRSERFMGGFPKEISEFERIAEIFLSSVLLSPELTNDKEDLLRLYLRQLTDRYGL